MSVGPIIDGRPNVFDLVRSFGRNWSDTIRNWSIDREEGMGSLTILNVMHYVVLLKNLI